MRHFPYEAGIRVASQFPQRKLTGVPSKEGGSAPWKACRMAAGVAGVTGPGWAPPSSRGWGEPDLECQPQEREGEERGKGTSDRHRLTAGGLD